MKGTLAYKDVNGNVWSITEDDFVDYAAMTPDGVVMASGSLNALIESIDETSEPEWVRETSAEPIQKEQLDTGAFPNESTIGTDLWDENLRG